MYRVLTPSPQTQKTQEIATTQDGKPIHWHRITGWRELGTAKSYTEARQKFGGRPVLEAMREQIHYVATS